MRGRKEHWRQAEAGRQGNGEDDEEIEALPTQTGRGGEAYQGDRQDGQGGEHITSQEQRLVVGTTPSHYPGNRLRGAFFKNPEITDIAGGNTAVFCIFSKSRQQKSRTSAPLTPTVITFFFPNHFYITPVANAP